MSTYGDRGNIFVLQKIAKDNGIEIEIKKIETESKDTEIDKCDLIFMGGGEDLQQEIVMKDLLGKKGEILKQKIENETPGLFICGAYQFLGKYYKDSYGTKIKGLGIFDMYTESFKEKERLTGNIVTKVSTNYKLSTTNYIVGFENHGGRTFLKDVDQAFGKVVIGFGNNGHDRTEGIIYKNSIGTYLHGPILPSNPELAVFLLETSLKTKYQKNIEIKFDDNFAKKAKFKMLQRLKKSY
jgi:CobQ-like glutamine amidotransferase family enzyme